MRIILLLIFSFFLFQTNSFSQLDNSELRFSDSLFADDPLIYTGQSIHQNWYRELSSNQLALGGLSGLTASLVASLGYSTMFPSCRLANGCTGNVAFTSLGYAVGASLGVYSIGEKNGLNSSFQATLGGAFIGSFASVLIYGFLSPSLNETSAILLLIGAPVGALIGNHAADKSGLIDSVRSVRGDRFFIPQAGMINIFDPTPVVTFKLLNIRW